MIDVGAIVHLYRPGERCRAAIVTDTGPELIEAWAVPLRFAESFTTDATVWTNPRTIEFEEQDPYPSTAYQWLVTYHDPGEHVRALTFAAEIADHGGLYVVNRARVTTR
jgi:hypothetical protein